MNWDLFVQNVKDLCKSKGVSPTTACVESGAGVSMLSQLLHKGTKPSVERIQMLAHYLGTTVSELIGETVSSRSTIDLDTPLTLRDSAVVLKPDDFKRLTLDEMDMVLAYRVAAPDDRLIIDTVLRKYKKGTTSEVG